MTLPLSIVLLMLGTYLFCEERNVRQSDKVSPFLKRVQHSFRRIVMWWLGTSIGVLGIHAYWGDVSKGFVQFGIISCMLPLLIGFTAVEQGRREGKDSTEG